MQGIENGFSSLLDDNGELHAYYYTDLDNRRLFAAKYTNTEVQANVHAFDSALSATEISRFTVGKNVPTTWGKQLSSKFKISLVNIPRITLMEHILLDGMENGK